MAPASADGSKVSWVPSTTPTMRQGTDSSPPPRLRYRTPTYSLPSARTGGSICSAVSAREVDIGTSISVEPPITAMGPSDCTAVPVSSAGCVIWRYCPFLVQRVAG